MKCITTTEDEQTLIDVQIDDFKKRGTYFGCPSVTRSTNLKTPTNWWSYSDQYANLQKCVIHVLSLICSSSISDCNRSSFEMVWL